MRHVGVSRAPGATRVTTLGERTAGNVGNASWTGLSAAALLVCATETPGVCTMRRLCLRPLRRGMGNPCVSTLFGSHGARCCMLGLLLRLPLLLLLLLLVEFPFGSRVVMRCRLGILLRLLLLPLLVLLAEVRGVREGLVCCVRSLQRHLLLR